MKAVDIGIDARLYSQTGVGTYLRNFLSILDTCVPDGMTVTAYFHEYDRKNSTGFRSIQTRYVPYRWHSLAEQWHFYRLLNSASHDLFHFTYFGYPVLYRKPFVATVHDLTPLLFKTGKASTRNPLVYNCKHTAFRFILSTQIARARCVITPTHTVKQQILDTFTVDDINKIVPVYEGVDRGLIDSTPSYEVADTLGDSFFLYVGNCYPHKNVSFLIDSWKTVIEDHMLVICGPEDHFSAIHKKQVEEAGLTKRIRFIHNLAKSELAGLYNRAKALIHPSLSEGFGLPVIEAMEYSLPVIASDIPVFQELTEGNYFAFNPDDAGSLKQALLNYESNPHKWKAHHKALLNRYSFFSMTKETLGMYQKALAHSSIPSS